MALGSEGGAFSLGDLCFRLEDLLCFVEVGFDGGVSTEFSLKMGLLG